MDVSITEYDVSVNDSDLQADFTRDFLIACFSHPSIDSIITWGFWEGAMWRADSALFAKDWSLTPMGEQWFDLIENQWRTNLDLKTDAAGKVSFRGFKGRYEVSFGDQVVILDLVDDATVPVAVRTVLAD